MRKWQILAFWMLADAVLACFAGIWWLIEPLNNDNVAFLLASGVILVGIVVLMGLGTCLASVGAPNKKQHEYLRVNTDDPLASISVEVATDEEATELETHRAKLQALAAYTASISEPPLPAAMPVAMPPPGPPPPRPSKPAPLRQQRKHPRKSATLPTTTANTTAMAPLPAQQPPPIQDSQRIMAVAAAATAATTAIMAQQQQQQQQLDSVSVACPSPDAMAQVATSV